MAKAIEDLDAALITLDAPFGRVLRDDEAALRAERKKGLRRPRT